MICENDGGGMEIPGEDRARNITPGLINGTNRIIGRNLNGTMVVTSSPSNEAELQLYRVLQRASLLAYYDTLLEMGGDDVQQLCEASEEEFLEIMSLVGMATKPLHVRRLQKTLQEYMNNPSIFQIPIITNLCPTENPFIPGIQRHVAPGISPVLPRAMASPEANRTFTPSPGTADSCSSSNASAPNASPHNVNFSKIVLPLSPGPSVPVTASSRSFSPQSASAPSAASSPSPNSSTTPVVTPVLLESHIQKLAEAAVKISKNLPQFEPKPQNSKKKMCKELELVMMMPDTDPRRVDEIRKYSKIYGRFDCKRRPEKPLTLHEVMVNEAAAQICREVPALLTRRDELFPLARQLVRKAGLNFPKHCISSTTTSSDDKDRNEDEIPIKRPRQEEAGNISAASPDAAHSSSQGCGVIKTESDDADSRCSSSSKSPPLLDTDETRPQVVAARGDNIIAVANPALHAAPPLPQRQQRHPRGSHAQEPRPSCSGLNAPAAPAQQPRAPRRAADDAMPRAPRAAFNPRTPRLVSPERRLRGHLSN